MTPSMALCTVRWELGESEEVNTLVRTLGWESATDQLSWVGAEA